MLNKTFELLILRITMARVTNIWIASADNDIQYVKSAIESGKHSPNDKDANGYTPIHAAASYGHVQLLEYLISKGGDINIVDEDGDTPLHSVEDSAIAKLLVETYNADWRIKNAEGMTALQKMEDEDEDEYADIIVYLKSLSSDATIQGAVATEPQFTPKVEYQAITDEQEPVNEENRKKIEEIMKSDNPEAGLQAFMEDIVRNKLGQGEDEEDRKRAKRD